MLMMIALVVLPTTLYAVAFRRSTWLRIPRKRATAAIGAGIALAALIGSTSAYGATHPLPDTPAQVAAATTPSSPFVRADTSDAQGTRGKEPDSDGEGSWR